MNSFANAIDFELQDGRIIEIGLTLISLQDMKLSNSYSIPIWDKDFPVEVRKEITQLTGWNSNKLKKQGVPLKEACYRLRDKFGARNRLAIVDCANELSCIDSSFMDMGIFDTYGLNPFGEYLNVSTLYNLKYENFGKGVSLLRMLDDQGLEFEGREHSAKDDSLNIARLFLSFYGKACVNIR